MDESAWRLYRSAGTLLFASVDVAESAIHDMLDSLLLAELAASGKHDPYEASSLWRRTWSLTMGQLHWAVTAATGQEEEHTLPFTLGTLMSDSVGVSPPLSLTTVLTTLGKPQVKAFESFCTRRHADSTRLKFSIGVAHCAQKIHLYNVAFDVTASLHDDWQSTQYSASAKKPLTVIRTSTTLTLVSDYAPERTQVITTLGDFRFREIERIDPIPIPITTP